VASAPAGILCGTTCSATYAAGTAVTLTATPAIGSTFTGWSGGGCAGTAACTLAAKAPVTVTATFSLVTYPLIVVTSGPGTVTSSPSGITCGSVCSRAYPSGTVIKLTAKPNNNRATFMGWSGGGCSRSSLTCTITIETATAVWATFAGK
jgi:phospholipase C